MKPTLLKLGVEQSPEHIGQVAILRAKLLDWSCSMQLPECFEYAQSLLTEWRSNPDINPYVKLVITNLSDAKLKP